MDGHGGDFGKDFGNAFKLRADGRSVAREAGEKGLACLRKGADLENIAWRMGWTDEAEEKFLVIERYSGAGIEGWMVMYFEALQNPSNICSCRSYLPRCESCQPKPATSTRRTNHRRM